MQPPFVLAKTALRISGRTVSRNDFDPLNTRTSPDGREQISIVLRYSACASERIGHQSEDGTRTSPRF